MALGQVATDALPAANPARPTVTNPATLTPVGYLQFEQGYLGSVNSPESASQYGVNQVTKLAVHPRLMFAVSSQPFAASTVDGTPGTSHDAGGIQVGFQGVLFTPQISAKPSADPASAAPPDQKSPVPTVAVGYYRTVYGGTAPDIDLGSATNTLLLLFSGDFGGFHYDTNYIANEQDDDSARGDYTVHRAQFAQTVSVNHSIFTANLQLSVEMYHFSQPTVHATSGGMPVARANLVGLLFAPAYQVRPNLIIDGGFERGLTSTSTHWQSFAGFTYLLPKRLWPERK
ncbi:MAG TPA: transporter [Terriglobales bacterium]|jgi:hypothetical protein|nr:transporter [Terriglobales bacterium]